MKPIGFIVVFLSASLVVVGVAVAAEGVVRTRDGQVFGGSLRLDRDRFVVVDSAEARVVSVDAIDVSQVIFDASRFDPRDRGRVRSEQPGALPADWAYRVLGSPQAGESGAAVSPGGVVVEEGRFVFPQDASVDANADQFQFAYTRVEGNREIMARVVSVEPGQVAGLLMRDSLEPGGSEVFVGLKGGRGGLVRWRERGAYRATSQERPFNAPDWVRLKRVGKTFSIYRSSAGGRWDLMERLELPMEETFYVGIACGVVNRAWTGRRPDRRGAMVDGVREDRSLATTSYAPRVTLRSGSMVAGGMESRDGTLHFPGPDLKPRIPVRQVASLNFQYLPRSMSARLDSGRTGALLTSGEFVDGEFRGIRDGMVTISSVLFGLRHYDLNNEIRTVVVSGAIGPGAGAAYEVETVDGSRWRASKLEVGENEILIWEPLLGEVRIPVYRLAEIRRKGV